MIECFYMTKQLYLYIYIYINNTIYFLLYIAG